MEKRAGMYESIGGCAPLITDDMVGKEPTLNEKSSQLAERLHYLEDRIDVLDSKLFGMGMLADDSCSKEPTPNVDLHLNRCLDSTDRILGRLDSILGRL